MARHCLVCGQVPTSSYAYPNSVEESLKWQRMLNVHIPAQALRQYCCVCYKHVKRNRKKGQSPIRCVSFRDSEEIHYSRDEKEISSENNGSQSNSTDLKERQPRSTAAQVSESRSTSGWSPADLDNTLKTLPISERQHQEMNIESNSSVITSSRNSMFVPTIGMVQAESRGPLQSNHQKKLSANIKKTTHKCPICNINIPSPISMPHTLGNCFNHGNGYGNSHRSTGTPISVLLMSGSAVNASPSDGHLQTPEICVLESHLSQCEPILNDNDETIFTICRSETSSDKQGNDPEVLLMGAAEDESCDPRNICTEEQAQGSKTVEHVRQIQELEKLLKQQQRIQETIQSKINQLRVKSSCQNSGDLESDVKPI